jgi:hypothetical protein
MRTATSGQAAMATALQRAEHIRVKISDADGDLQDWTAWVRDLRVYADIDSFAPGADVTLFRERDGESLAPLMTVPQKIAGGRRITIEAAFTAIGATPETEDWALMFDGRVDDPEWGGLESAVRLSCRSRIGAMLHDRWLETPKAYSGTQQGVMQEILDDALGEDAPTLLVIGDPEQPIEEYTQRRQSVQDALQALTNVNGWLLQERWDDDSGAFRLTLYDPPRDQTVADASFDASSYFEIAEMRLRSQDVRTVVIIEWQEGLTGTAEDTSAIEQEGVGRKVLYIDAVQDVQITTQEQAEALAALVLHDVSTALAYQGASHGLFWRVELGDLYEYASEGTYYSAPQLMAVVGYEHAWSSEPEVPSTTMIRARGRPTGGADRWFILDRRTRARDEIGFIPDPNDGEDKEDGSGGWYYTTKLGSAGFLTASDPAGSLGKYISITRVLTTGLNDVFRPVTVAEQAAGVTLYAVLAIANTHPTLTWEAVKVYLGEQSEDEDIVFSLGLDPEGVVAIDSSSAQGESLTNTTTAPSGAVTFSAPTTLVGGLAVGDLGPNECALVHVRLAVTAGAESSTTGGRLCAATCPPS